jgi:4-hydroxy-tetrahydrodipicolinate reductase
VEVAGGIDPDPEKVGRDLGEMASVGRRLGAVRGDGEAALAEWRPDVVLHTTQSFLGRVEDQLATILRAGAHVVSSTEELFYPRPRDEAFCQRIDELAQQHGVAVVGTGVNPGFAMDVRPLALTSMCTRVERLEVRRVVDASRRRLPLRRKIGAGRSRESWEEARTGGGFGHIGLEESARAVAGTLGWPVEALEERLEPVVASRRVETEGLVVEEGQVAGIHQVIRVTSGGRERLYLELRMAVGAEDPVDRVDVIGEPSLTMRVEGGIFGDTATVAALINTVPRILHAAPGLRTAMELPVPCAFGT